MTMEIMTQSEKHADNVVEDISRCVQDTPDHDPTHRKTPGTPKPLDII
jgi:hypothetical protein